MQNKKTWLGIFILILIEQIIKLVINFNFFDKRFPILPPVFYFEPVFNRHYSWINSMLRMGDSKWIHIILVAILIIFIYLFYQYINKKLGSIKIINIMFAFVFSGAVCSLIDKIFWNGSLDYIYLKGLFVFDLKDLYVNVFIGVLFVLILFKNKVLMQIDDEILKGFIKYILRKSDT